jgi:3-oxosteroid 1-dehydrogenase
MGSVENEQKELTRRQFVKGTAVGGVAGLVITPPFYSAELALTCTNTQGGPKHNGKAQTLDQDGKPIPRLYTPGELGSFFGFLYPGGSNIPEAISFGRIAGENAAAERPWT